MNEERHVEVVPARSLVFASKRFDFGMKMALVRAWLNGDKAAESEATVAYLETIRAACDFHEVEPRKEPPQEFLRSFRATFDSIRANGFRAGHPIRVGSTGEPLNSAHRLSIAAVLGLDVQIVHLNEPIGGKMDAKRFRRHHLHLSVERYDLRAFVAENPYVAIMPGDSTTAPGAVVWYSSRHGKIVRLPERQDHSKAMEALDAIFPPMPFPNWKMRWLVNSPSAILWRLDAVRHRLLAMFTHGRRRKKHLLHIGELRRRWRGMKLLADFVAAQRTVP